MSGNYKERIHLTELKTKISISDDFEMLNDNVLVEIEQDMSGVFQKNGIWLALDSSKSNANNTVRRGVVRALPKKFYYRKEDGFGADWKNKIQLKIGDVVWFGVVGAAESDKVVIDEKLHYIIPYKEMIVTKRLIGVIDEDRALENVIEENGQLYEIVMLNGYCLVQMEFVESNSFLKLPPRPTKECTICFCGEPNEEYFIEEFSDDDRLNVGDKARVHSFRKMLEDKLHLSFNGDEEYMVVQRRHLTYKW